MIPGATAAGKSLATSAARWMAVFAGATVGAYAGRVAAAMLYNEPVSPLLEVNPRTLLQQDVAPGFLAAELIGRGLGMGLAGEAVVAALAAGISAVATGPLIRSDGAEAPGPQIMPMAGGGH